MNKPVILCVDDEKIILNSLKEQLKQPSGKKFMVETVESGEEAIELFEELLQEAVDVPLVITDHIMPGLKGDALLIHFHNRAPETLKVLLTGQANAESVGNVVNHANLYRYISKPWDREDLVLTVREATRSYFQTKQLKEKEEEYRDFVQALNVGVCRTSAEKDGRFIKTNPALAKIFGYQSIEQFMQTTVSSHFENPADLTKITRLIQEAGHCKDLEIRMQKKDGTPLWAALSATAQYGKDGKIQWINSVIEDITKRKLAAEQLKKLNKAYERFVPVEFLNNLGKKSIVDVELNDQVLKTMTILFSDIRNFSAFSEQMTPKENFRFINSYLSRMGPIVRNHKGFIDKYIGDSIMALFGDRADNAVQAAKVMIQELKEYNKGRKRAGYHSVRIGVGINTGSLMLGTLGEQHRMEGTVISDAVNLASRLEGLTKIYGTPLLISENTLNAFEDHSRYFVRFIDRVQVKGKTESVSVYEIFDNDPEELRNTKQAYLALFEDALYHYYFQEIKQARKLFEELLFFNPDDTVARVYLERCMGETIFSEKTNPLKKNNPFKKKHETTTMASAVESSQEDICKQVLQLMEFVKTGCSKEKILHKWNSHYDTIQDLFNQEEKASIFGTDKENIEHKKQHGQYISRLKKIRKAIHSEKENSLHLLLSIKSELVCWLEDHFNNSRHFSNQPDNQKQKGKQ